MIICQVYEGSQPTDTGYTRNWALDNKNSGPWQDWLINIILVVDNFCFRSSFWYTAGNLDWKKGRSSLPLFIFWFISVYMVGNTRSTSTVYWFLVWRVFWNIDWKVPWVSAWRYKIHQKYFLWEIHHEKNNLPSVEDIDVTGSLAGPNTAMLE